MVQASLMVQIKHAKAVCNLFPKNDFSKPTRKVCRKDISSCFCLLVSITNDLANTTHLLGMDLRARAQRDMRS